MQPDHFAAWHDEDLVRALTLERANYQDSYLASVAAELARRNVDPQAFIDQVEVRYHADASATCTITQALAKASEELPLWHLLAFTRYFGDTLVVQRELRSWLVNVYRGEEYASSFFVAEGQSLQDLLRRFLTLADWGHLAGTTYQLDSWQPLLRTRSPRYMQKIATALADEGLPFTVQTPVLSHDPRGQLTLLVPDPAPAAIAVLHKVEDHLSTLRDQATAAFAANDRDRELAIYAELVAYGLNNPAIYYNLASALAEAGRYAEAATAFVEAASLSLAALDVQVPFQSSRGTGGLGGIFGMVGTLISALKPDEKTPTDEQREVPDYIEDIELQLAHLLKRLPQDLNILHALAAIAAIRHDVPRAREHYRQITEINPADETAKHYLAEQAGE